MRRWMIGFGAAGALAAAATLAGAATAQEFGREGGGFGGRFATMSPDDLAAFTDARIAALHAGLKLNADQEKLWPPVEAAIRGLAKQRQEAREARREHWASMRDQTERNIPEQLRFMADRQAASADALRKLADASSPLYAALDSGQKRRMAVLSRGFMRHGMGRRWHRGGMEGPAFGPMRHGNLGLGNRDFAQGQAWDGKATAR